MECATVIRLGGWNGAAVTFWFKPSIPVVILSQAIFVDIYFTAGTRGRNMCPP